MSRTTFVNVRDDQGEMAGEWIAEGMIYSDKNVECRVVTSVPI